MSRSREPLLDVVARHSKRELSRHPNSGGWVEEWEPIDEWGKHVPLQLLPRAGRLAMDRLIRLGLVETDGRTMIRLAVQAADRDARTGELAGED